MTSVVAVWLGGLKLRMPVPVGVVRSLWVHKHRGVDLKEEFVRLAETT